MNLIEEPARKVFLKQCSKLVLNIESELSRYKKWVLTTNNKSVSVRLVWIQGIITNISELPDSITLDDGSGRACLMSVKDAHGFGSWIQKGQYVMVVGEVLVVTPTIRIKPVKLTHLVDPNAEILWMLEILDFWKFLETT